MVDTEDTRRTRDDENARCMAQDPHRQAKKTRAGGIVLEHRKHFQNMDQYMHIYVFLVVVWWTQMKALRLMSYVWESSYN